MNNVLASLHPGPFKNMCHAILLFLFHITIPASICAETMLPAEITEDMTLTEAASPYLSQSHVSVGEGVLLKVEAGVDISMAPNTGVYVYGELQMNGTDENPITMHPAQGGTLWDAILVMNPTGQATIAHVEIRDAKAAIVAEHATLHIDSVYIDNVLNAIVLDYCDTVIKDSTIRTREDYSTASEQWIKLFNVNVINVKHGTIVIENCDIYSPKQAYKVDTIDFQPVRRAVLSGNRIYGCPGVENSDCIDINQSSRNVTIQGNLITNCRDKGISVGTGSSATIQGNLIANCAMGIGIKESSYAFIDRNTLYNNSVGIACFEKNNANGGGYADVVNTVMSHSLAAGYTVDEISSITITYSLSEHTELPGENNITADPLFVDPANNDFSLQPASPCINTGDPASSLDPDGTRADMGSFYYHLPRIVINEIHYKPFPHTESAQDYAFLELYNAEKFRVDLSGFSLLHEETFTFAPQTGIDPGRCIVFAENQDVYADQEFLTFQWPDTDLFNKTPSFRILDSYGHEIDCVTYGTAPPWPLPPNGHGPSLSLINPLLDNTVPENWACSLAIGGSPGKPNNISTQSTTTISVPPTTTTTTPRSVCPMEIALNDQRHIQILRDLRDTCFTSGTAQTLLKVYYEHADELSKIMIRNSRLRSRTRNFISSRIDLAEKYTAQGTIALDENVIRESIELLQALKEEASPQLQQRIDWITGTLGDSYRLRSLGIRQN